MLVRPIEDDNSEIGAMLLTGRYNDATDWDDPELRELVELTVEFEVVLRMPPLDNGRTGARPKDSMEWISRQCSPQYALSFNMKTSQRSSTTQLQRAHWNGSQQKLSRPEAARQMDPGIGKRVGCQK